MDHPERELKILLTRDQYETLQKLYPFSKPVIQVNTYYDTSDDNLKNMKAALRIRRLEGKSILTLKLPIDSITKREIEFDVSSSDLSSLKPEELAPVENLIPPVKDLKPIITFTTERQTIETDLGTFCLDKNIFPNKTDYELEYEYKSEHDGIKILNDFLKPVHLKYSANGPSKLARALS